MKAVSLPLGTSRMTLVIKTVKGKKYVYEQYRHNGVVVTKYIRPLEEMVRIYQLYKIRRLTKTLLQEYDKAIVKAVQRFCVVNSMGNQQETIENWWARGDLNPGPPPCEGGVLTRLDDGPTAREHNLKPKPVIGLTPHTKTTTRPPTTHATLHTPQGPTNRREEPTNAHYTPLQILKQPSQT